MFWSVYQFRCQSKNEMPKWLGFCGEKLKIFFCLCFPKEKDKVAPKIHPLEMATKAENGELHSDSIENNSTKEETKKKCKFCDRCKDCEKDFKKNEDKKKDRKDFDGKLEALNYFFSLLTLLTMFITQMAIWVSVTN